MSSILFLFYNAFLLKKLIAKNIVANEFVDDILMLINDDTSKKINEILTKIHEKICIS